MRRHTSDEAYKLAAEKLQRIEAEAHARSIEEEQILARLETTRRTVAVEAQARSEQEKRIKEEIEMFRRLEEEERPRLEAAVLQRTEVETASGNCENVTKWSNRRLPLPSSSRRAKLRNRKACRRSN